MGRAARSASAPSPFDADVGIGVAVSGGADSLALLLLAADRFPDRIEAATFDHGFRAESAAEAAHVAAICASRGIPHATLRPACTLDPYALRATERARGGLQALARAWRYRALATWCADRELRWLLTAHHADDQAETVLMRMARGSGPAGLSGIRPSLRGQTVLGTFATKAPDPRSEWVHWIGRPLLGFAKAELGAIVEDAGLSPVDDPSNSDPRFDRTRARRLLAETEWLDPRRLSAVADIMRDTEEALFWAMRAAWQDHVREGGEADYLVDPSGLPPAILRRLCEDVIRFVEERETGGIEPSFKGAELTRFVDRLRSGETATIGHVMATPGKRWHFTAAPPRRDALSAGPRLAIGAPEPRR